MNAPVNQLRAFVERVERLEAEIKELNADKSEIFKEAKGCGFDVPTIKKVVAKRRMDTVKREEQDALFDLYWSALQNQDEESPSRVHVHVREGRAADEGNAAQVPPHDTETGELIEGSPDMGVGLAEPACAQDAAAADIKSAPIPTPAHSSSRAAGQTGDAAPPPVASPVAISDDDVPAFVRKPYVLRPYCREPEECAGYGTKHCHTCERLHSLEVA